MSSSEVSFHPRALALELLLVRFSQIVVELPWVKEIDINPLIAAIMMPVSSVTVVLMAWRSETFRTEP